jgi:hypothetical protein
MQSITISLLLLIVAAVGFTIGVVYRESVPNRRFGKSLSRPLRYTPLSAAELDTLHSDPAPGVEQR